MMITLTVGTAATATTGTGGYLCLGCGYTEVNCWCTPTATVTTWQRNWWDEDEEVADEHHRHLISANWFRLERLPRILVPLVYLWPQARAPPTAFWRPLARTHHQWYICPVAS